MSGARSKTILHGTILAVLFACGYFASAADAGDSTVATKLGPSPVQVFREVLVMTPDERESFFIIRPPVLREPIEAKINEYLALPAEERELRLQATELRHYLTLLMAAPVTNHPALLAQIAEPMRTLVRARLDVWQLFPDPMRGELLENEQAMRYFTQFQGLSYQQRSELLNQMSPEQRARVESDIARWRDLPEPTRNRLTAQFSQFFELAPEERQRTLANLSEPERMAMARTLEAFRELPPQQREQCLRSFTKFASLSLTERQQFLKKAEAWQKMSPSERQQWRELVQQVPSWPPFPQGFESPPPVETSPLATNGR
jgi:hypothetical protein